MSPDPIIQVTDLSKSFGNHLVLDQVDLDVARGSVHALLGSNGAGKTTMVRILSTLLTPDSGTATIDGHSVTGDPRAVRNRSASLASMPLSMNCSPAKRTSG